VPELERDDFYAYLVGKEEAQRADKTVTVFKVKKDVDSDFATNITWWPPDEGGHPPNCTVGEMFHWWFTKKPVPGGKGFYRNLIDVKGAASTAPAPTTQPRMVAAAPTAPRPATPAHQSAWDAAEERKQGSIARSVALNNAVSLAVAGKIEIVGILNWSRDMLAFLHPQAADAVQEEPAAPPPADPSGVLEDPDEEPFPDGEELPF